MGYDVGADSYLVKPIAFGDLLAMAGQIQDYSLTLNVYPRLDTSALDMLSSRERRVLQLVVDGKSIVAIATARPRGRGICHDFLTYVVPRHSYYRPDE